MPKILLIDDNEITRFLKSSLKEKGHAVEIEKLGEVNNYTYKDLSAIIDLTNADAKKESSNLFIHNTGAVKQLMDAAKMNSAPFIFIYKENLESKSEDSINIAIDFISQYGKTEGFLSTVVQIEDIYGQDLNTSQRLNDLIGEVLSGKPIKIDNDANDLYLMHQKDFVSGIQKIIEDVSQKTGKSQYTLFNPEPITEIELVHFIKDLTDLKTDVKYSIENETINTKISDPLTDETNANFPDNWEPEVSLETGLHDLFKKYDIPIKGDEREELAGIQLRLTQDLFEERAKLDAPYEGKNTEFEKKIASLKKPEIKEAPQTRKLMPKKKLIQLGTALAISLALPSIIFSYSFITGLNYISKAEKAFSSLNLKSANALSGKANARLSSLNTIPTPILLIAYAFGINPENSFSILNSSKNVSEMILFASSIGTDQASKSLSMKQDNVLGASTSNTADLEIERAYELANLIENDISHLQANTPISKEKLDEIKNFVLANKALIDDFKNISPVLPDLLGYTSNQTFLLVLQDPNELRPSGGKLKEYGIIKVENGKFTLTKVGDISEIDEQLELNNALKQAPQPILEAFKNKLFYLKDANWQPNFPDSAKTIENLYQLGTNTKITGVIAINYPYLQSLSKTNERKSLSAVFDEVFKDQKPQEAILQKLLTGLATKNIQIFHNSETIMNALSKNNWAGEITTTNSDDYLYIVDSNLGGNTSNKYINKSVSYKGIMPQNGNGLIRNLVITYKNTSENINSSDSQYINYVRIYVPKEALLNSAKLVSDTGEQNIIRSIKIDSYKEYAVYATDILVQPGKSISLILNYESPKKTYDSKSISLTVQMQPGDSPQELNLDFENSLINIKQEKDETFNFPL